MTTVISFAEVLENAMNSLGALEETDALIEEKIATRKVLINGLIDNMKWLQAHTPISTSSSVEEIHASELIEHEGKMLRKVEREAKDGDYVKFFNSGNGILTDTLFGKFYKTVRMGNFLKYLDENAGYKAVYSWLIRLPIVEVYEVFSELPFLPQSAEVVADEKNDVVLTANQKRANAIKKAKEYIEVAEESKNTYKLEYRINRDKRAVTVLVYGFISGELYSVGVAKCHPNDTFNEFIGKSVALNKTKRFRAIDKEILNAPNPDEVVKGQVIEEIAYNAIHTISEITHDEIRLEHGEFYWKKRWTNGELKITDDTNANYEGDK